MSYVPELKKCLVFSTEPFIFTRHLRISYNCMCTSFGLVWNMHVWFGILIYIETSRSLKEFRNCALRLCVKQWDVDYTSLLFSCNLPALATRRNYFILSTMYKIVNHLMDFPTNIFIPRAASLHSTSSCLYLQPFSHTNSYLFSFVPNACSQWNKLPSDLRSSDCLSLFKRMAKYTPCTSPGYCV